MSTNEYNVFIRKNGAGGNLVAAEVNHEIFIRISDNRNVPVEPEKLEALVRELVSKMTEPQTVTNGDKIRSMTNEELAVIIMCPYDGEPLKSLPCASQELMTSEKCIACSKAWLSREAKES